MSTKELYRDDLLNRFDNHTFTETIVDDHIFVEFKDINDITIASAKTLVVDDAYKNIRENLVGDTSILLAVDETQRDNLLNVDDGQEILNLTNNTHEHYSQTDWDSAGGHVGGHSTGLISDGGELTGTFGQTTFNISAGEGQIVDNSDPAYPDIIDVLWSDFNNVTLTELGSSGHTYVLIDSTGAVVQIGDVSLLSEVDRKNKIYLGVIRHGNGAFIAAINQQQSVHSPINRLLDLYIASGKTRRLSGNEITVNAGNSLSIDKSVGRSYGFGVNFTNDTNNPDISDNLAIVQADMLEYSSVVHLGGAVINTIPTTQYDPNGANNSGELVNITGGATRVAHRIWIESVTNLIIFQYGQATYSSEADAFAEWQQEDFTLPTGLTESAYLKEIIIIQNGETDLNNATFIPVSGGGGGGGSISPVNIVDDLLSTDPNSALSANQGRLLTAEDLANSFLSGANIHLVKKGGGNVVITNGAANIANASLTFNGPRTVNFDDNIWLLANVPTGNTMLVFDPATQSLIGFAGSNFKATATGLDLQIAPGVGDLKVNGVAGDIGQVITSKGAGATPTWENPNTAAASMQVTTFVYDDAAAAQDVLRVHGANLDSAVLAVDVGTLGSEVITPENKLITADFTPDGGQTEVTLTITKGTEEIKVFTTLVPLSGFEVTDAVEELAAGSITIFGSGFTAGTTVVVAEGTIGAIAVAGDGRSLLFPYTRAASPGGFIQITVTESAVSINTVAQLEAQENTDYAIATATLHKFTGAAADQWTLKISGVNFVGGTGSVVTVIDGDQGIGGANGTVGIPLPIVYPGDTVIRDLLVLYTAPAGQKWAGFEVEAGGKRQHFDANITSAAGVLAADSYLSINNTTNDAFQISTVVTSTAGFGNNYNVLQLIDAFLHRTIDPSGMLQLDNTCVIQVDGVYDIHWSVSDDIGTQTYVHIRVNGSIISSGHSGSDTGAAGMVTNTVAELIAGDIIEFAFSLAVPAGSTNLKRPNITINQIR